MSRPGRPRSASSREAILRAASELLIAEGYEALSIAAISEHAGVGRQTIYRWWKSKAGIIAEAAVDGLIAMPTTIPLSTPDHTLMTWIEAYVEAMSSTENQSLIRALTAAAAEGDSDSSLLYRTLTQPTQRNLTQLILADTAEHGNASHQTEEEASVLADAIIGTVLVRVLTRTPVSAAELSTLVCNRRCPHTTQDQSAHTDEKQ